MTACEQQIPVNVTVNGNIRNEKYNFITNAELTAYIQSMKTNLDRKILIIDCGSPLRHTERRIQDSLLVNANDRISRKRLITRGIKNFLDNNQLNRLNNSEHVILYDDANHSTICSHVSNVDNLQPSMKTVHDEIKENYPSKTICILQSSFDEFYHNCPTYCYISTSTDEDLSSAPLPVTAKPIDIESFEISEVLPGLYLGSSRDAENFNLLKQKNITTIINISTSIPCHFEHDKSLNYTRLPCHDSSNQNILQYFETTLEYIKENLSNNKNILVHCQGGVSRSPSFVIAYIMKYHTKNFEQAHAFVKSKRSIINPNLNFLGQLTQYQDMLIVQ